MTIKEFEEKAEIGAAVRHNRMPCRIFDINKAEHKARLAPIGLGYKNLNWVHCMEFELTGEEVIV